MSDKIERMNDKLDKFDKFYSTPVNQFYLIAGKCMISVDFNTISRAFSKAQQLDSINGINKLFIELLQFDYSWTLDQILHMINLGATPVYDDFAAVHNCKITDVVILYYFITQYNIEIDIIPKDKLISTVLVQKIIDNGHEITEKIIKICIKYRLWDPLLNNCSSALAITLINMLIKRPHSSYRNVDFAEFIIKYLKTIDSNTNSNCNYNIEPNILNDGLIKLAHVIELTIDDISLLENLGADLRHNDDELFVTSCCWKTTTVPNYLLDRYHCNINASNSRALTNAISHNAIDNIKMLLERGIEISESSMLTAFRQPSVLLVTSYVNDPVFVAKLFVRQCITCIDKKSAKKLVESGFDINKAILDNF